MTALSVTDEQKQGVGAMFQAATDVGVRVASYLSSNAYEKGRAESGIGSIPRSGNRVDGSRIVDAAHADRRRLLPQDAEGNKKPGKTTRITGSELLIIEPEYVLWDDTAQLYPFVFESIGDWDVTTSVAPPEGFIADYEVLEEYVDVTITEVGSDPVPTQTILEVVHNGEYRTILSTVDIKLTADYAESRGFDVDELRAAGLIMEQPTARSTR